MPRYYLNISEGKYSGSPLTALDLQNDDAAWTEMTKVGCDLVAHVMRDLTKGSNWQMETLDEEKNVLFRIRLVAESST
jgi:hypothetical protein